MGEECGSAGKNMIDNYTRKVLPGWNFRGIRESGDKVMRAQPLSSMAGSSFIKIVKAPWNLDFLIEMESFPEGRHDDIVDSCANAFQELTRSKKIPGLWSILAEKKKDSVKS